MNRNSFYKQLQCFALISLIFLTACSDEPKYARIKTPSESLSDSIAEGDTQLVARAIERGIYLNAELNSKLPLGIAASSGQIEMIALLLSKGAEIDAQDKTGTTALMHAAKERQADAVQFLIDKGANTQIRNNEGKSALSYAQKTKNKRVIKSINAGIRAYVRKTFAREASSTLQSEALTESNSK